MSNNRGDESRGASITPSARPGIHDHCKHKLGSIATMVTYGSPDVDDDDNRTPKPNISSDSDQGHDEVDNVLSKHSRHSPIKISVKKSNLDRRHSYDLRDFLLENEDPAYQKAKSFPETNLKNYYSDQNLHGRQATNFHNASWPHHISPKVNSVNVSNSSSVQNNSISINYQSEEQKETQTGLGLIWLITVVTVIVAVYIACSNFFPSQTISVIYDGQKFYSDLNNLGDEVRLSDDSILQVQTGISSILQKEDTGSFVFAYNSNSNQFNQNKFNYFMDALSTAAAKLLRNDSTYIDQLHHIVVDTSQLDIKTDVELISGYRDHVSKTGVMLVKDLDRVPSKLAMAFHYYCDEYNPLVKKSAIFFTLDVSKCSTAGASQHPTHAYIEKCLTNKWPTIPQDNIGPLLTRVVGNIIDVTNIQ